MALLRLSFIAAFLTPAACHMLLRGTPAQTALVQWGSKAPDLADQEVHRMELEKLGGSKHSNLKEVDQGGDEERLSWDDGEESFESREEEEYSLAQTGKKPCCHTFKPKHLPHINRPRGKKEKKPTGAYSLLQTEHPKFHPFKPRILHPRKEKKPTGAYSFLQTKKLSEKFEGADGLGADSQEMGDAVDMLKNSMRLEESSAGVQLTRSVGEVSWNKHKKPKFRVFKSKILHQRNPYYRPGMFGFLQTEMRPNLADEEVRRLKMEKMGHSKSADKGGDDERLDWDDDDESIRKSREEEEYSLAQRVEGRPNLADEEVRRLEMEKMGHSKIANRGGNEDEDEEAMRERQEEEYSLTQATRLRSNRL